jgi:hypothetical protein
MLLREKSLASKTVSCAQAVPFLALVGRADHTERTLPASKTACSVSRGLYERPLPMVRSDHQQRKPPLTPVLTPVLPGSDKAAALTIRHFLKAVWTLHSHLSRRKLMSPG